MYIREKKEKQTIAKFFKLKLNSIFLLYRSKKIIGDSGIKYLPWIPWILVLPTGVHVRYWERQIKIMLVNNVAAIIILCFEVKIVFSSLSVIAVKISKKRLTTPKNLSRNSDTKQQNRFRFNRGLNNLIKLKELRLTKKIFPQCEFLFLHLHALVLLFMI